MGPLSVVSKRETEITLSWSSLIGIATGNSDILSYNLYWDDNTGIPSILLASDLITNFTVKGTSGGKTYKFQIKAANIYGEGVASDELIQLASDVPD